MTTTIQKNKYAYGVRRRGYEAAVTSSDRLLRFHILAKLLNLERDGNKSQSFDTCPPRQGQSTYFLKAGNFSGHCFAKWAENAGSYFLQHYSHAWYLRIRSSTSRERWRRHSTTAITVTTSSESLATIPVPSWYPCPSNNDARLLCIFQELFSPFFFSQENGQLSRICSLKVPYYSQELEQTTKNEAIPGHSLFISCRYVRRRCSYFLITGGYLDDRREHCPRGPEKSQCMAPFPKTILFTVLILQ